MAPLVVNSMFKEPIYQVLDKIKHEPYLKLPNKIGGDPTKRNQNLYCQYQDRGHTTEDCRTLQVFMDQLVKAGKLKQFLQQSNKQVDRFGIGLHNDGAPQASLGTINVIFATPKEEPHPTSGIMLVSSQVEGPKGEASSKRPRISNQPIIGFSEDDKLGTIQPHCNALVVTLRIARYDVKRVMIDQGNGAEIMYLDLFKGLGLKPKDLDQYDAPLIRFNGNVNTSLSLRGESDCPF